MTDYKKKLIEVALPLEAINDASAYDKMPGIGPHPKGVHKWWAPLPLPAARAVLFASLVDDPSAHPERYGGESDQRRERERLMRVLRGVMAKDAANDASCLADAREEIARSCPRGTPVVVDPFAGSGAIPLEAQRLGLEAHASDLNPVAVLITKALIEIPPKFAGLPPVNPASQAKLGDGGWHGAQGLAEDVRYYGRRMREEVERRIGHLYPKVKLPPEQGGGEATVIAWLWARTVRCPNPACGAEMPLVRSFVLSTKKDRQAWVEPIVDHAARTVRFEVRVGKGVARESPKVGRGAKFRCLVCGDIAEDQHIKDEAAAGRMSAQLMAIVAEGQRARIYLPPDDDHVAVARSTEPAWAPEEELPYEPRAIWCTLYGLKRHRDLYTDRQLVALTTFSDLVGEARKQVLHDTEAAIASGAWPSTQVETTIAAEPPSPSAAEGYSAAMADSRAEAVASSYADAVGLYLAFALDRCADFNNTLCRWVPTNEKVMNAFARQALPMVWDYAEANVLADVVGGWQTCVEHVAACLATVPADASCPGLAVQLDARAAFPSGEPIMVSTDPPYYDNIGYSDLSDFFYVWLRRSLRAAYGDLLSTLLTPKAQELISSPYRHEGRREAAQAHFQNGFAEAFTIARRVLDDSWPMTVYYAFKQAELGDGSTSAGTSGATGWASMLQSLVDSGFMITATWPIRASQNWRITSMGTNALASYIVLACRRRGDDAPLGTRRELLAALRHELPQAIRHLQEGSIAPVDLAQAAIGPGMAVFSRYSKVMEADGSAMSVRTALGLINQVLDEILAEQEGEFDADTRWAIAWFEQFGMQAGEFGVAEVLSKAKNTSVDGLVAAGVLESKAGKVRLLRRDELPADWDPVSDKRPTVWEMTQHLIRRLDEGEAAAAALARRLGGYAEAARDLAYRLYLTCERKKWAQEALAYNALVVAWPRIAQLAAGAPEPGAGSQTALEI